MISTLMILLYWHVWVLMNGHLEEVRPEQTATEVKPGWKIVDIQTRSHKVRYLWGMSSMQLFGPTDTLVVDPGEGVLSDFVLVPLKRKAEYRRLNKEKMMDNKYQVLDFHSFDITPYGDDAFRVTPLKPLPPGEYIIYNRNSEPMSEMGDYEVYPITVK